MESDMVSLPDSNHCSPAIPIQAVALEKITPRGNPRVLLIAGIQQQNSGEAIALEGRQAGRQAAALQLLQALPLHRVGLGTGLLGLPWGLTPSVMFAASTK